MSSYLELCQEFRSKAGIAGTGPTTVLAQSGEYLRLVTWIKNAWIKIQNYPRDWKWMWREYSIAGLASTSDYVLTDVEKIHEDTFSYYLTATGTSARQKLKYINWKRYTDSYSTVVASEASPALVTRKPNGNLKLWPTPDAAYTIDFEYQKTPQILAANADEPEMPAEYHEAILYLALVDHGGFEEASEVYGFAANQYSQYFKSLLLKQELRRAPLQVRVE
jgi:hypothetical protein